MPKIYLVLDIDLKTQINLVNHCFFLYNTSEKFGCLIMLEIKKVTKVYKTEGFKQTALDKVSVNFRTNEFAAILGPSGSGKTTFLNIIGGLDDYTSGDLVINEEDLLNKDFSKILYNWDCY